MRAPFPALAAALLATALLFPAAGRADEAADRHAAAVEVLHELHSVEMVSALLPAITAQVRRTLTHDDPDLVKEFDAYAPHLAATAQQSEPALLEKLADIYATTFTLGEMTDMLAYYRSPVGQRIIATQSTINQGMLAAARDWGTSVAQAMTKDAAAHLQGAPDTPPN